LEQGRDYFHEYLICLFNPKNSRPVSHNFHF
jgi:hypothetical protein